MKIAITGHANIENALDYPLIDEGNNYNITVYEKVYIDILTALFNISEKLNIPFSNFNLISGMARGVDEIFALIAVYNNLPLHLSIPNSVNWHKHRLPSRGLRAQAIHYDFILQNGNIQTISEIKKDYMNGNYKYANMARNQHMIDIADIIISYKVPEYSSAGTDDGIYRAQKANKYYGNVFDLIQGSLN
jgi:hypothetical protein